MRRIPVYLLLPIVLLFVIGAFYMTSGSNSTWDFLTNLYVIGTLTIAFILTLLIDAINQLIENQRLSLLPELERAEALEANKKGFFESIKESAFDKQTEKEEQALILDHGFDGITELDNNLPKWWLGILYVTIVYAVVYGVSAMVTDFSNPEVQYEDEVAWWDENAEMPDGETVIAEAQFDPSTATKGEAIFVATCVKCHAEGGGGSIGPNLTDDYWKNINTDDLYSNIVSVVWNGAAEGAMQAFGAEGQLGRADVEAVAAYIKTLQHTVAAKPKVKEGTLAPWATGEGAPQGEANPITLDGEEESTTIISIPGTETQEKGMQAAAEVENADSVKVNETAVK